jgi:SAM-dependent methyltransferase
MDTPDEVRAANERHWNRMVDEGCGFTIPWLDLDPAVIRQVASGDLEPVPEPLNVIYPTTVLAGVEGKDVLCLASGGGQQSAVFGLLGARVTVVDLAEGQLQGDREAAEHYGYQVTTLHADMQDLSCLGDASFDLVYGTGMCYIPDLQAVYAGAARVLRRDGRFRADFGQPAVHFVEWDGEGFRITRPYTQRIDRREDGAIEFRHYLDDIFNGLLAAGLSIEQVEEVSRSRPPAPEPLRGSWDHFEEYVGGGFAIVARKQI